MNHPHIRAAIALTLAMATPALALDQALIVVEDRGGVPALPYYEALDPQRQAPVTPSLTPPAAPLGAPMTTPRFSEADMLPVISRQLTPGDVEPRVIRAPGLMPLFLIGDDERSHAWLRARGPRLREMRAVGLVVNVASAQALSSLRRIAPGLTLSPVAGDDMAQRLGIRHYPVLITATGIEP